MNGSPGRVLRLWRRLPIVVRAVLSGLFVFVSLQLGWNLLALANLAFLPSVPWSAPLTLVYLWLVFRWFGGRGRPASTSAARSASLRARWLTGAEWRPALAASGLLVVFIISTTILAYRLIAIPADPGMLPELPWWSLYTALLMISIVAGVSEEAGFRGYMQGPLERRYGPAVAITIASVMFWLAHLNHTSGMARGLALMIMGASLGVLAHCARSIWPAILTHAAADSIVFVLGTASVGPDYIWNPVLLRETGLDGFFWLVVVAIVLSGAAAFLALRRLARVTGGSGPDASLPASVELLARA